MVEITNKPERRTKATVPGREKAEQAQAQIAASGGTVNQSHTAPGRAGTILDKMNNEQRGIFHAKNIQSLKSLPDKQQKRVALRIIKTLVVSFPEDLNALLDDYGHGCPTLKPSCLRKHFAMAFVENEAFREDVALLVAELSHEMMDEAAGIVNYTGKGYAYHNLEPVGTTTPSGTIIMTEPDDDIQKAAKREKVWNTLGDIFKVFGGLADQFIGKEDELDNEIDHIDTGKPNGGGPATMDTTTLLLYGLGFIVAIGFLFYVINRISRPAAPAA